MLGLLLAVLWLVLSVPRIIETVRWVTKNANARDRDDQLRLAMERSVVRTVSWMIGAGVALWLLTRFWGLWVQKLWYQDLGYTSRFWAEFWTKTGLFAGAFALAAGFYLLNLGIARKLIREMQWDSYLLWGLLAKSVSLVGALLVGLYARSHWLQFLLYLNGQPFGKHDPVFGNDIGFYVFTMPVLDVAVAFGYLLIIGAVIIPAIAYGRLLYGLGRFEESRLRVQNFAVSHLSGLGVLLLVNIGLDTFVNRYKTLFSEHGHVFGAGWTDLHVRIPAYWAFIAILAVSAILLLRSVFSRSHRHTIRNAAWGFGIMAAFWVLGVVFAPWVAQIVKVKPNELNVETPYIQREIDHTRAGFGLDRVNQIEFPVQTGLTAENLAQDTETLDSARLWDWEVLVATNHQLQAFKSYYVFKDVDVVRYRIGGKQVQLMYSGRELDVDKLPESAKTWQNMHLVYTHGMGGTANPVNAFTSERLPDYWIKDLPPVSRYPELAMRQPRIYFGEAGSNHVYVNTGTKEFDYPVGEGNAWFRYDGPAGIPLGGFFRRLAIAWAFDGVWKTWSDELTAQSRLLFDRDVYTRTYKLLPGFFNEDDAYQVVADGQLWYMRDFYSVTKWYPYSRRHDKVSYIRNSVKAVVNAYTGKTDLYVSDPADPIIRAYAQAFPGLFKPMAAMPPSLRAHVRYPAGLFSLQGSVYASYHMREATSFYNKEDMWQEALQFSPKINEPTDIAPYYVIMGFPGGRGREYVLLNSFAPKSTDAEHQRNNLEAILMARCDGAHYGEIALYKFPTTTQVQGPLQVGIKMNQDDSLSKEFSLWNQQGSRVVLGGMRTLPLSGHRLLNVQAVYLQSEGARMPQLKYVVVASGDQVVYDKSFDRALGRLAGTADLTGPAETESEARSPKDLVTRILGRLDRYFSLLQSGQFSEAGREMQGIHDDRVRMKAPQGEKKQ